MRLHHEIVQHLLIFLTYPPFITHHSFPLYNPCYAGTSVIEDDPGALCHHESGTNITLPLAHSLHKEVLHQYITDCSNTSHNRLWIGKEEDRLTDSTNT